MCLIHVDTHRDEHCRLGAAFLHAGASHEIALCYEHHDSAISLVADLVLAPVDPRIHARTLRLWLDQRCVWQRSMQGPEELQVSVPLRVAPGTKVLLTYSAVPSGNSYGSCRFSYELRPIRATLYGSRGR